MLKTQITRKPIKYGYGKHGNESVRGSVDSRTTFLAAPSGQKAAPFIVKTAAEFEQKDAKHTKSVICEGPAQI